MADHVELGLLFILSERDVWQPVAWREFVDRSEGKTHLYCHPKDALNFDSILRGHEIEERHPTEWGGFGITLAMFALLRAAEVNRKLTHFMFVSESCAPIKPWRAVERSLKEDPRSRIDWNSWSGMNIYHQRRKAKTIVATSFWRVHSQWMLLDREVVEFLLDRDETLDQFKNAECSDEHAIGTIMSIHGFEMSKINRRPITWTRWKGKAHPEIIRRPTPELCEEWRSFDGFCARKVSGEWDSANLGLHI